MTTLAALPAKARGDAICTHLAAAGLKPVWMEAEVGDRIAIGIEFISEHPTWTKAFSYAAAHATPIDFIRLVNEWKAKVRRDLAEGEPSTVVKNSIEAHGIVAVLEALEPTSGVVLQ